MNKKLTLWLLIIAVFCISSFIYVMYNIYQNYKLLDNKNYQYHPICINNHLYIRFVPRLGITPVYDKNYNEPRLVQCSVKNGKIIYDKESLLLLNNE